jgi:polyhydroxyalkanoate synthesis regulator phasin
MPKKKPGMTPEEQSERFKADAQKLIDAGELSPTEAEAAVDQLVRKAALPQRDGA